MDSILLVSAAVESIIKVGMWVIQLLVGLVVAMGSIFIAMRLLNRLTKGLDEEEELLKGNKAVACMMLGVVIAVALVTSSGIVGLTDAVTNVQSGAGAVEYGRAVAFGVVQLAAGILFAVISIFLAFRIWDKMTTKIDEVAELKKDNVAVGIVMAGVIIAVAIVIREGISGLAAAISGIGS